MSKVSIMIDLLDPESVKEARKVFDRLFADTPPMVAQAYDNISQPSAIEPPPSPTLDVSSTEAEPPSSPGVELAKDTFDRLIPWDVRIHAKTKTQTKDGKWKLARGVDKTLVSTVENELFSILNGQTAAVEEPSAPIEPPPSAVETPADFPSFMAACTQLVADEKKTLEQINIVLHGKGFSAINQVVMRPDLIPEIWAEING